MDVTHALIEALYDIARWPKDIVLMPTRIRALAEKATEDRDKRLICTSCGTGRVGDLRRITAPDYYVHHLGTCSGCGLVWRIDMEKNCLEELHDEQGHG